MTVETGRTAKQHWHEAAKRVAHELGENPGQPRAAKIDSLLHAFRIPGEHCHIADLVHSLGLHGVTVSPEPPMGRTRRDVLDLRLEGAVSSEPPSNVRVSFWTPGGATYPEVMDSQTDMSPVTSGAFPWFDVDPRPGKLSDAEIDSVVASLRPWCPGLDDVIVKDLLTPDAQPNAELYGEDEAGLIRKVSIPALLAREFHDDEDDFDGIDEQLIVQMVEIVVGPTWVITCWQPAKFLGELEDGAPMPSLLREPMIGHVMHRWLRPLPVEATTNTKHPGHLAVYLARSLVETYSGSLRTIQQWVANWEVGFYEALSNHSKPGAATDRALNAAANEISNVIAMVSECSRMVSALQLCRDEMPNKTWFFGAEAEVAADHGHLHRQTQTLASSVDAAADKLAVLYNEIRADMQILTVQSQTLQQEAAERMQSYLGKVTGLILVPTFVAGLYGANTQLPGGGRWSGFEIMLVLMVLSASVSYWIIRRNTK